MRVVVDNGPLGSPKRTGEGGKRARKAVITLRSAVPADAPAIHALIVAHLEEGRLLPRALDELAVHAPRFVVAVNGERIVGCAELAPLSQNVAEVRSLVVSEEARRLGVGIRMVEALATRARHEGFARLCAFAHEPGFFVRRGFSIVPHTWVPEKIAHDYYSCPLFRNCGQYATVLELDRSAAVLTAARGSARLTMPAHV